MGATDGGEICELVGLYILDVLCQKVPEIKFGLNRDNGLAEHPKMNGRTLEKLEQRIRNIFNTTLGLKITIQKDMDQVDFLDITWCTIPRTCQPVLPRKTPTAHHIKQKHTENVL